MSGPNQTITCGCAPEVAALTKALEAAEAEARLQKLVARGLAIQIAALEIQLAEARGESRRTERLDRAAASEAERLRWPAWLSWLWV